MAKRKLKAKTKRKEKAIRQSKKNDLTYAITAILQAKNVKRTIHDGDTVDVTLDGDFGVRFLGMDTAEVSFTLPGEKNFTPIQNPKWKTFLTDPFATQYGDFSRIELDGVTKVQGDAETVLGSELTTYLRSKLGPDCAANHAAHSGKAKQQLVRLIKTDLDECMRQRRSFRFFLTFCYTIVDRYGRLLAFVNRHDENPQERLPSYNDRMIKSGYAAPYFIWPNVNPFRIQPNRRAAVPTPEQLLSWLSTGDGRDLEQARQAVGAARQAGKGIFSSNAEGPLAILPFELRYLAGRRAPDRYVLDLSKAGTVGGNVILEPRAYHHIPNIEDRLFIEADDLGLFLSRGYVVES